MRATGSSMRKLVLILIAFIAVVTFIRAFDNSDHRAAQSIPVSIENLEINH